VNVFLCVMVGLLLWGAIAVPVGVLVGRMIRLRDRPPDP
jgi:hypothetical protein